jgi:hypothetical protein
MSSLDAVSPKLQGCHRLLALPATHSERAIAMTEAITPRTTDLGCTKIVLSKIVL